MNLYRTSLILLIAFHSCTTPENHKTYTIKGSIKGHAPEMIYMEYHDRLDSARVVNNTFEFTGEVPTYAEAYLRIEGVSAFLDERFYLENEDIDLTLNIEQKQFGETSVNLISIAEIKGTKTALLRQELSRFKQEIEDDPQRQKALYQKLQEIVTAYPAHPLSSNLIIEHAGEFTSDELIALAMKLDTTRLLPYHVEAVKRRIHSDRELKVGSKIADFALTDAYGNSINTRALRGKIVLIDFWASWCGPCRKKYPRLKEVYREYKSLDLEVLGISLDTDPEKWKRALEKDDLPWLNVLEDQGFKGKVASRYNVMALPTTYLIDEQGTIIATDVSPEILEEKLKAL